MKRYLVIALLATAVLAGYFGIKFIFQRQENLPVIDQKRPLPDFTLKDYNSRDVKLSDFRGKNMLVNTWASWCPFCRKELSDFASVQKEFGDKIVIIAIDRAEPLEIAKKYSDDLRVTNNLIFLLDPSDLFYKSIGGFSMPETVFVDKEGNIRDHKRGPMGLDEIRRRIKQSFDL